MLLQILWSLETLGTKVTVKRLQGNVDAEMRRDVVALDRCHTTLLPQASQRQIVGGLAAHVVVTEVLIQDLGGLKHFSAWSPMAHKGTLEVFLLDLLIGFLHFLDGLHGALGFGKVFFLQRRLSDSFCLKLVLILGR